MDSYDAISDVVLPLSAAQMGVWMSQALDPASPNLKLAESIEIDGLVSRALMEAACRTVVEETQALHARFVFDGDTVKQIVRVPTPWSMTYIDWMNVDDPGAAARRWMQEDLDRPFDLTKGRLFSLALLKLSHSHFVFYHCYHHIVVDGFGRSLLLNRIAAVYNQMSAGTELVQRNYRSIEPLIREDVEYRSSSAFIEDRDFWREYLGNLPEAVTTSIRPTKTGDRLIRHSGWLAQSNVDALNEIVVSCGVRLPQTLIAAVAIYLFRLSGASDVILSLPVTNRAGESWKIPGMTSNVLPLRLTLQPGRSFTEIVGLVATEIRKVLNHRRYMKEDIYREFQALGMSFGPSVNVMAFDSDIDFAGLPTKVQSLTTGAPPELSFTFRYRPMGRQGLSFRIGGSSSSYSSDELKAHHSRFRTLLQSAAANHTRPIGVLDLLAPAERQQILTDWNATAHPLPETTLPLLFERQVERTPDAVALIFEDAALSYAQLNARANRLAHHLIAQGTGPEHIVGIALPRSADMVVALLAVLKSGAAYLPLDPDYPADRLALMIEGARPAQLITSTAMEDRLPAATPSLSLDRPDVHARLLQMPAADPTDYDRRWPLSPSHPAYVIYTSGSTGKPKGVVVTHRNMWHYLSWAEQAYYRHGCGGSPTVFSINFDAGITTIFGPLISGQPLHLLPTGDETEVLGAGPGPLGPYALVKVTPSHLKLINQAIASNNSTTPTGMLMTGGEALAPADVAFWQQRFPEVRLINEYGPTETTVGCTTFEVTTDAAALASIPIGRPIWNVQLYVLDAALQPIPVGVSGELYIGGAGLARGYLNRPALTAERFVANPFGEPGSRLYRTGDLVRWLPDGNLDFLGRLDHQVKIRGFRIEPGEIEATLARHPAVAQAAVVAREDRPGHKQLVGYVVATPEGSLDPAGLRRELAGQLPDYMVPAAIVVLDALPLTVNGKLDRKALPAPEFTATISRGPRSPQEEVLAGLFAEVLGLDRVGVDDSFFDLGGHSLLATRLVSRVRSLLEVEVPIRALFDTPTIAGLAQQLTTGATGRRALRPLPRPEVLPLSFAQRRLWFLHQFEGPGATYNIPLALRLDGSLNGEALRASLGDLLGRHESLRTIFTEVDGVGHQTILPAEAAGPVFEVVPTSAMALPAALSEAARHGFDLAREVPVRATLFRLSETQHVLLLLIHHIASDGGSLGPLSRDLGRAYAARCQGQPPNWPAFPVHYADYAALATGVARPGQRPRQRHRGSDRLLEAHPRRPARAAQPAGRPAAPGPGQLSRRASAL